MANPAESSIQPAQEVSEMGVSEQWQQALSGLKQRIKDEIDNRYEWLKKSLESVGVLKVVLDQDRIVLSGQQSGDSDVGAVDRSREKLVLVPQASEELYGVWKAGLEQMLDDVDKLQGRLSRDLNGSDSDQAVIVGLESTKEWKALMNPADGLDLVSRLDGLTTEVTQEMYVIVKQSKQQLNTTEQHLWAVDNLIGTVEFRYASLLEDLVYDDEIRGLMPGIAGEGSRSAD